MTILSQYSLVVNGMLESFIIKQGYKGDSLSLHPDLRSNEDH